MSGQVLLLLKWTGCIQSWQTRQLHRVTLWEGCQNFPPKHDWPSWCHVMPLEYCQFDNVQHHWIRMLLIAAGFAIPNHIAVFLNWRNLDHFDRLVVFINILYYIPLQHFSWTHPKKIRTGLKLGSKMSGIFVQETFTKITLQETTKTQEWIIM